MPAAILEMTTTEVVCVEVYVAQGTIERTNGRTKGHMRLYIIKIYMYVRHIEGTRNFGRYIMTGNVKTERRVSPPRSAAPALNGPTSPCTSG